MCWDLSLTLFCGKNKHAYRKQKKKKMLCLSFVVGLWLHTAPANSRFKLSVTECVSFHVLSIKTHVMSFKIFSRLLYLYNSLHYYTFFFHSKRALLVVFSLRSHFGSNHNKFQIRKLGKEESRNEDVKKEENESLSISSTQINLSLSPKLICTLWLLQQPSKTHPMYMK